jgi:dCTP diphosphatase
VRYQSPKNLAQALAGEVGELSEVFQWLSEAESSRLTVRDQQAVQEELADIVIYVLRLADVLSVDLEQVVEAKLSLNEARYPVETSRGDRTKHTAKGEGFHVRSRTS